MLHPYFLNHSYYAVMKVFAGLFQFSVINAGEESFSHLPRSRLVHTALNGFLKQLADVVQGAFFKKKN